MYSEFTQNNSLGIQSVCPVVDLVLPGSNARVVSLDCSQSSLELIRPFNAKDSGPAQKFFSETGLFSDNELSCLSEDLTLFLSDSYEGDQIFVYDDGAIRGLIHFGPMPISEQGWGLHWIGVDPCRQKKGIGKILLRHMEMEIISRRGRIVLIETSSRDIYAPTREFYLKNNYNLVATVPDYYSAGDSKCIFLKTLGTE